MKNLDRLLDELVTRIHKFSHAESSISKADIGWHIEHSLLVLNSITDALAKSDPIQYKRTFSFIRLLVFAFKKIPRGKGRAPEIVKPKNLVSVSNLQKHLLKTRLKLKELDELDSGSFFRHPVFGNLRLHDAKKFLLIHTKHHLAIIDDILRVKGK